MLANGDTLHGKIDYRNWEVNPLKIRFQQAGTMNIFLPKDLQSFEVTDADVYVSSILTKDMQPVGIAEISPGTAESNNTVTDTVFLRRLVNGGRVKLYQLIDSKEHYYVQRTGGSAIQELGYKMYTDERHHLYEEASYKNQLAGYITGVDDAGAVLSRISRSRYNETDLTTIVHLLNGDKRAPGNNKQAAANNPAIIMAGAGINYVNFRFTGNLDKWNGLHFPVSIGESVNVAVDLSGARNFQQISLRLGLSYTHQVYNGTQYLNDFFGRPAKNNYKLVQNSFTPELAILYHVFRQKKIRVYAGFGLAFNISSYPVNEFTATSLTTGEQSREDKPIEPSNVWLTANVMMGARLWNKLNVNISSSIDGSFINYTGLHTKMFPLAVTVAYIFVRRK